MSKAKEKEKLDPAKEIKQLAGTDVGVSMLPAEVSSNAAIAKPAVSTDEAMEAWEQYQELKTRLKDKIDIQMMIINGVEKEFLKKSYWRKVATFYNLTDQIISEKQDTYQYHYGEDKIYNMFSWRAIVRVMHPNGRTTEGSASCSLEEQWTPDSKKDVNNPPPKARHNIYATAVTRAKNRAISDMVGGGEVSAEEMQGQEDSYNNPDTPAVDPTAPYVECPECKKPMTPGKTKSGTEKFDCTHGCKQPPDKNGKVWNLTVWEGKETWITPSKEGDDKPAEKAKVSPEVKKKHDELAAMKELFIASELYDEDSWKELIKSMKAEYKEINKVFFNAYNLEHLKKLTELINATYDREIDGNGEDAPDIQEPLTKDAARLMESCNKSFEEMDMKIIPDVEELKGIAEEIYKIPTEGKKYIEWIGSLSIRLKAEVVEFKKNPPVDKQDLPF